MIASEAMNRISPNLTLLQPVFVWACSCVPAATLTGTPFRQGERFARRSDSASAAQQPTDVTHDFVDVEHFARVVAAHLAGGVHEDEAIAVGEVDRRSDGGGWDRDWTAQFQLLRQV